MINSRLSFFFRQFLTFLFLFSANFEILKIAPTFFFFFFLGFGLGLGLVRGGGVLLSRMPNAECIECGMHSTRRALRYTYVIRRVS